MSVAGAGVVSFRLRRRRLLSMSFSTQPRYECVIGNGGGSSGSLSRGITIGASVVRELVSRLVGTWRRGWAAILLTGAYADSVRHRRVSVRWQLVFSSCPRERRTERCCLTALVPEGTSRSSVQKWLISTRIGASGMSTSMLADVATDAMAPYGSKSSVDGALVMVGFIMNAAAAVAVRAQPAKSRIGRVASVLIGERSGEEW